MATIDIYLRFADNAEACAVFGGLVVADPIKSKEIAVSIAEDRIKKAFVEFEVKKIDEPIVEADVKGIAVEVDANAPLTKADVDLKVEDAVLAEDWKPEVLPVDGNVLGFQFDLITIGTVFDEKTARTGHHVLARFRGAGEVPDAILAYETTPWNQVIG